MPRSFDGYARGAGKSLHPILSGDGSHSCIVQQWRWLVAAGFFLTTATCGMAQEPASRSTEDLAPAPAAAVASGSVESPMPKMARKLSKAEAKIVDALNSPTSLEFIDTPLTDVVAFIADHHGIAMQLDTRALADAAIPVELPITFEASKIKLRSALALMLSKYELAFHYRNEALIITTSYVFYDTTSTRVYPIYDLLGDDPDGEGEAWVDIVHTAISPLEQYASSHPATIEFYRGRLVVNHNEEAHRRIASLLAAMQKYHEAAKAAPGKPLPTVFSWEYGDRTREAWDAILAKEVDLESIDTPLADIALFLSRSVGAPVRLDERALEDSAIPFDLPISYQQSGVSLRAALAGMRLRHDLGWVIKHGVLLITTRDVADNEVVTRIYPVADLVRDSDGALHSWQLMEVLQTAVEPYFWETEGGPGAVIPSPSEDVLIVTQTEEAHEGIKALLEELRRAAAPGEAAAGGGKKPVEKPDHSRKVKVFELPDGVDAEPLAEIARAMFEPERWPAPEGGDVDKAVVEGVPGRLVVRHEKAFTDLVEVFLAQADATQSPAWPRKWRPIHGWLTRAPIFELGETGQLNVRCYHLPPAPAVRATGEEASSGNAKSNDPPRPTVRNGQTYEPLVRDLVLPGSWNEAGPGRVRGLPGLLIVRHTPKGQREVVKLLQRLIPLKITPPGPHQQTICF